MRGAAVDRIVTESIAPRSHDTPEIKYQPSLLSLRSSSSTVKPADEQPTPSNALDLKPRAAKRRLWFFTALSVVAGVMAAKSLQSSASVSAHVHSGSPGFKRTAGGETLRWKRQALTVHIDNSVSQLGPDASGAVTRAFGSWVESDPRLPDLSFDSGQTSSVPKQDGKNTVSYGRIAVKGHEQDLAITVSYADDQSGEIVEADIVLNSLYAIGVLVEKAATQANGARDRDEDEGDDTDRKRYNPGSTEQAGGQQDCGHRYDVQNVITHEVGHFFGLGEDAVERRAAMFQTIDQCEIHKRVLATTDVGAIATLYASAGEPEQPEEATAGARGCSFAVGSAGVQSGWACLLLAGLGLARRRRPR